LNGKMATYVTMTAPITLDDAISYTKKVEAGEYYGQTAQQVLQRVKSKIENLVKKMSEMIINYANIVNSVAQSKSWSQRKGNQYNQTN
ncbi:1472_t:CDS:1, partial [Racocetra persica]